MTLPVDPLDFAEVRWMLAPLRRTPAMDAALDTEVLRGETVARLAPAQGDWVRVRLEADGYEGYLPEAALGTLGPAFTHRVTAPRTLAYPAPDFKQPPIAALTMGARVRILRTEGRYAVTAEGEYLIASHLAPVADHAKDPVAVAETLLGTPYLWGGKSALGIDCSGLVQLALGMCGMLAPRDSGPQERAVGAPLPEGVPYRRGDLLCWKGHVALVRDEATMIHANAHAMMVAVEGLADGIARIAAAGDPLRSVRRLAQSS